MLWRYDVLLGLVYATQHSRRAQPVRASSFGWTAVYTVALCKTPLGLLERPLVLRRRDFYRRHSRPPRRFRLVFCKVSHASPSTPRSNFQHFRVDPNVQHCDCSCPRRCRNRMPTSSASSACATCTRSAGWCTGTSASTTSSTWRACSSSSTSRRCVATTAAIPAAIAVGATIAVAVAAAVVAPRQAESGPTKPLSFLGRTDPNQVPPVVFPVRSNGNDSASLLKFSQAPACVSFLIGLLRCSDQLAQDQSLPPVLLAFSLNVSQGRLFSPFVCASLCVAPSSLQTLRNPTLVPSEDETLRKQRRTT